LRPHRTQWTRHGRNAHKQAQSTTGPMEGLRQTQAAAVALIPFLYSAAQVDSGQGWGCEGGRKDDEGQRGNEIRGPNKMNKGGGVFEQTRLPAGCSRCKVPTDRVQKYK